MSRPQQQQQSDGGPAQAKHDPQTLAALTQRRNLLVPPATIVSPPTPIEPRSDSLSFPFETTPQPPIVEEVFTYDSPDEDEDDSPILPTPPPPPRKYLDRGSSTGSMPISKTSMSSMASSSSKTDDSSFQSPATSYPSSLPSSSPHLFAELGRVPSPSSPSYGPTSMRQHRRQSSQHRVRETIYAEERNTIDGARLINQYRIGKHLGRGAYATVELAMDVGTGIQYAMKEFSKSRLQHQVLMQRQQKANRERRLRRPARVAQTQVAPDNASNQSSETSRTNSVDEDTLKQDPLALIRREIAVMKKLDHPNLIHLYEAISVPNADALLLVLEYLPGGVLMNVKLGGDDHDAVPPFTEDQSREYFRQIGLALEYLHANGVVHRDIKPDNILFNSDRSMVKLADFGVSEMFQASGDDTLRGAGGSPAFLSPESFSASLTEVHGKPVDFWALGVTLYCMLTGKLPFNTPDPIVLMSRIRTDEPTIPDEWHDDLKALVKGMLCKDADARHTMATIRENPWVTDWARQPMLTVEDNLFYFGQQFYEPTQDEVSTAITSLRSVFTVVRAVKKMQALTRTRRLVNGQGMFGAGEMASLRSGLPAAERQSSIDSYHLPEAITATHEEDEEAEEEDEEGEEEERGSALDTLTPIKAGIVDAAHEGPAVVISSSPEEVASPVEFASSPIAELPARAESPTPFESPKEMASPLPMESPSPVMVDSPTCESPAQCESPARVESPVPFDSPVMATPPRVASPLEVHSPGPISPGSFLK